VQQKAPKSEAKEKKKIKEKRRSSKNESVSSK